MKFSKFVLQSGTILDKIVSYKIDELEGRKRYFSLKDVEKLAYAIKQSKRDFYKAINKDNITLIAEIKKASPSRGVIRKDFDVINIAEQYIQAGASAISVLTDNHFFQGKLKYLRKVKEVTNIPVLRKDFIFDPYQVYESKANGADAILLITTILSKQVLKDLYDLTNELDMDCLIETHDAKEIEKALAIDPRIIGINNRNLKTFKEDLNIFVELSSIIPTTITKVSESAIQTRADVIKVQKAGASAILVGTTLMQSDSIFNTINSLLYDKQ